MELAEPVRSFLLVLLPIMVAMDAPGILPLLVGMTEGMKKQERRTVVRHSIMTAFFVTIGFVLVGRWIFDALGILVEDFMIAGGILLLIIATTDIVRATAVRSSGTVHPHAPGVVPLGTPIIAGPAVLTTSLVLQGSYGYAQVLLSLVVNLLIAWFIFGQADRIIRLLGINGTRAFAKVASLILAAYAVMLIRNGILQLLEG